MTERERLQSLLADVQSPGQLPGVALWGRPLFVRLGGSRAYNLHNDNSDRDYQGVYLAPSRSWLGLNQPASFWPPVSERAVWKQTGYDVAMHEARSFAQMLLGGNPAMLELLYTTQHAVSTPVFERLRERRSDFLTLAAARKYLDYGRSQRTHFRASLLGPPAWKPAVHMLRAFLAGLNVAQGMGPTVWLDDASSERTLLLEVRQGRHDVDWVCANASNIEGRLLAALDVRMVPEQADPRHLEDWLLAVRLSDLTMTHDFQTHTVVCAP